MNIYIRLLSLTCCSLVTNCSYNLTPLIANKHKLTVDQAELDNKKLKIEYELEPQLRYEKGKEYYPIGHMVVTNKSNFTLKLYNSHYSSVALLKTRDDEVLANVTTIGEGYKVLDTWKWLFDVRTYRLDLPSNTTVKLPLKLNLSYAPEEVIKKAIQNQKSITIELYPWCSYDIAAKHPEKVKQLAALLNKIRKQGHSAPRLAK